MGTLNLIDWSEFEKGNRIEIVFKELHGIEITDEGVLLNVDEEEGLVDILMRGHEESFEADKIIKVRLA